MKFGFLKCVRDLLGKIIKAIIAEVVAWIGERANSFA